MPSRVKVISLSSPSMRSWIQPFCAPFGNVQEFDAERLAIGSAQNGDDLADGAEFEAEHFVEKDRAVEVGVGETVGARIELFFVVRREAERIEIGVEMAARTIGADQHQGAHGITRRALDIRARNRGRAWGGFRGRLGLGGDLAGNDLLRRRPIAIERRDEFAIGGDRPARSLPGWTVGAMLHHAWIVVQGFEKRPPLRIDRRRIGPVSLLKLFDIDGIAAIQKRRRRECVVAGDRAAPEPLEPPLPDPLPSWRAIFEPPTAAGLHAAQGP